MQPTNFPGAIEIKKPASMTDEQCMSTFATIHYDGDENVTGFTQKWMPNLDDMNALNNGEGVYIHFMASRLAPVSVWTVDENGNCNES